MGHVRRESNHRRSARGHPSDWRQVSHWLGRGCGDPAATDTRLYARDKDDLDGLRRIVGVAALPDDWRDYFKEQINRARADVQQPSTHPSPAWPGFRPFSLREKVRESENVASFHLIPEDGRPLPPYLPGQYLTVRLAIPGVERPVVRSYSLSDAARSDRYRLTIKRIGPRPGETHARPGVDLGHFDY